MVRRSLSPSHSVMPRLSARGARPSWGAAKKCCVLSRPAASALVNMKTNTSIEVREIVRETYGQIAAGRRTGCCALDRPTATPAVQLSYSQDEIAALPDGADLGLGCVNPQALASLGPGETVLDLSSGAGFDCFLASRSVGPRAASSAWT